MLTSIEPDASKTRTWTDRSGTFKVEAQFIGLKDGKIHLHKLNGVKIAVSVAKMAIEDLEYVERVTGESLDDDKPLSDIRRRSLQAATKDDRKKSQPSTTVAKPGLSTTRKSEPKPESKSEPKAPDYDWFDFFLKAGVNLHQCERYALNFSRDSMDESVLPDITPTVLRTLGLKEGDILRVMKYLDSQYGRTGAKSKARNVSFGGEELIKAEEEGTGTVSPNSTGGGLFSGPGGALRNNTRKGRPAPAIQNDDVVNAKTFKQRGENKDPEEPTSLASTSLPEKKPTSGFDDDAWDVKPSKQASSGAQPTSTSAPVSATTSQPLTGAFAELSLLTPPLQPLVMHNTGAQQFQQPQKQEQSQPVQTQTQPTEANQSFFSRLNQQTTGSQLQQQIDPAPNFSTQPTFQGQQPSQPIQAPRQRPQAPPATPQGSLLPPPPTRPLSAPQNVSQNNSFGPPPLQPQLTGAQNQNNLQNFMAPPGQSLNELDRLRAQQQQQQYGPPQIYPQSTGFAPQNQGFGQFGNGIPIQQNYGQQYQTPPNFQNQQPFVTSQQTGGPFTDPRVHQQQIGNFQQPLAPQITGYSLPQSQSSMQPNSINSVLPPPLQPQITAAPNDFGSRATNGYSGVNRPAFGQPPPIPSSSFQPQSQQIQPPLQPLQPQKTGPAPSIRFGVNTDAKKLVPQATGRKANLSQASKLFF